MVIYLYSTRRSCVDAGTCKRVSTARRGAGVVGHARASDSQLSSRQTESSVDPPRAAALERDSKGLNLQRTCIQAVPQEAELVVFSINSSRDRKRGFRSDRMDS